MITLHICIVEDEEYYSEYLKNLLNKWEMTHPCKLSIKHYNSGESFVDKPPVLCDLIFLDVELNGMNGMELAHHLRRNNFEGTIIFVTSHKDYAFESYKIHAFDFLAKPITLDDITTCMNRFLPNLPSMCYVYKTNKTEISIPFSDILFFSSCNHHTVIHTLENNIKHLQNFKTVLQSLPEYFVQCHRTSVVNVCHIVSIVNSDIILTNYTKLPVSQSYSNKIHVAFIKSIPHLGGQQINDKKYCR